MRSRLPLFALAAVVLAGPLRAQSPFKAGTNYIGPFISLATYGSTAAFGGDFEHAINDKWGWGLAADYYSFGSDYADGASVTYTTIAGTGAYHFDVHNEKVDAFVGGAIGYNVVSSSAVCTFNGINYCGGHASGILIGAFGGVRYWMNEKLALTAHAGYGLGFLSIGVDFKL